MSERGLGRGKLRRVIDAHGRAAWQADYTDASGKRRRPIVGHDKRTADQVLAKLIRERDLELAGLGQERGMDLEVAQILEQYLRQLATKAKPVRVADTRKMLERMIAALPAVLVRHITKTRVAAWRHKRVDEGASNKTINNAVVALSAALNYAVSLDQLPLNPLRGLKAMPITERYQTRIARALDETELDALLAEAARYDAERPAEFPRASMLTFLVGTGARWGEVIAARWGDFDAGAGSITLRAETTKTERTRTLPLHECVLEALRRLLAFETARRGRAPFKGDPLFRTPEGASWTGDTANFRRYLRALLERVGIPYRDETGRVVHVHALRHTFATRCMRAGVAPAATQKLLGHASPQMTLKVYTHASAKDARDAIRALPQLGPMATQPREQPSDAQSA